jgi:hypothetical protein
MSPNSPVVLCVAATSGEVVCVVDESFDPDELLFEELVLLLLDVPPLPLPELCEVPLVD